VATRTEPPPATDDRSLRAAVLDAVDKQSWTPLTTLNVMVQDGIVDLWGTITNEAERRGICVLAENTPGVKKVNDHLVFVEPYTGTVIAGPMEKE
jgi:osmotically-inducible protein OsmY